jgi:hypothetical protein
MSLAGSHGDSSFQFSSLYGELNLGRQLEQAATEIDTIAADTTCVKCWYETTIVGPRFEDNLELHGTFNAFDVSEHIPEGKEPGGFLSLWENRHAVGDKDDPSVRLEFCHQHGRRALVCATDGKGIKRGDRKMPASLLIQ